MEKISSEFCNLLNSNDLQKAKIKFKNLDVQTSGLYLLISSKIIKNPEKYSKQSYLTAQKILKLVEIQHDKGIFKYKQDDKIINIYADLQKNTVTVLKPFAESLGITGLSKMKKADIITACKSKISFNPPLQPTEEKEIKTKSIKKPVVKKEMKEDSYEQFDRLKRDVKWNERLKDYINSIAIISRLYKCESPIGSGAHSIVFNGKSSVKTPVAFKIEIQRGYGQLNLLRYEQEIIRNFKPSDDRLVQNLDVFWNINYFEPSHPDWKINIIISPLYVQSLEKALKDPSITQETKLHWARESILCIKQAHNIPMLGGVLHRDIKPENFCLQKDGKLVLIDFGLADWANNTIQKALKNKKETIVIGSRPFNSFWSELLIPQAYRDDTQSVGFMIWRILYGPLPWEEKGNRLLRKDAATLAPDLLKPYFKHCDDLKIEQKPDYNFLISLFK